MLVIYQCWNRFGSTDKLTEINRNTKKWLLDIDRSRERHYLLEFILEIQQKSYSNQMNNYAGEHLFSCLCNILSILFLVFLYVIKAQPPPKKCWFSSKISIFFLLAYVIERPFRYRMHYNLFCLRWILRVLQWFFWGPIFKAQPPPKILFLI